MPLALVRRPTLPRAGLRMSVQLGQTQEMARIFFERSTRAGRFAVDEEDEDETAVEGTTGDSCEFKTKVLKMSFRR